MDRDRGRRSGCRYSTRTLRGSLRPISWPELTIDDEQGQLESVGGDVFSLRFLSMER